MEKKFEFTIPNEKRRLYNRFALLLFILNGAAILLRFFYFHEITISREADYFLYLLPCLLILLLCYIAFTNTIIRHFRIFLSASFLLSLFWFITGPWWVGPVYLILTLFFLIAQRELIITVSSAAIWYPSVPRKKIEWGELSNLVFKDGLLTIDFKNDKLIQQYPTPKINLPDEKEFNEFCRENLGIGNQELGIGY